METFWGKNLEVKSSPGGLRALYPNKWMEEHHTVRIPWEAIVQERENAVKFSNSEALGSSKEVLAPDREERG